MAATSISFQKGCPPAEFFPKAWASEPLTAVLEGTNIPFALPGPDLDVSLVAQSDAEVVGQCSANRVVKYWTHLDGLDLSQQNRSTALFVAIHKKAVQAERDYLAEIGAVADKALHNAGIAVVPEQRGRRLGVQMVERQIEIGKASGMTTLFCETTNRYSAAIMQAHAFDQIAQYPYRELATELGCPELARLDDSFTVWCRKI